MELAPLELVIAPADPLRPDIAALLAFHLAEATRISPAGSVHALPAERLREPGVTFYAGRVGAALAVVGALRRLDAAHGELKSMRAAPDWRGQGAGRAMLQHLIAEAQAIGLARLSLETGRSDPSRRRARCTPRMVSRRVRRSAAMSKTGSACA